MVSTHIFAVGVLDYGRSGSESPWRGGSPGSLRRDPPASRGRHPGGKSPSGHGSTGYRRVQGGHSSSTPAGGEDGEEEEEEGEEGQ